MTRALAWTILVAAVAVRVTAHDPITTKVTWSREIAPIVSDNCAGCHRPDGPAPMSLASYADARPWAKAMRAEVVAGRMPRWAPVRGFGHFANDRSLSSFETALIAAWADGGAPEGDEVMPDAGWPAAHRFDERIRLEARTEDPVGERRTFRVARSARPDTSITGWRFFANDPAIVQAEFSTADGRPLGSWVPPEGLVTLPDGVGLPLPADAEIIVTVWYRAERLQQDFPVGLPSLPPVLGLVTSPGPVTGAVATMTATCGETPIEINGDVIAVRPVSGTAGTPIGVALAPPGAPPVPLVRIRSFDPAHLESYRLATPVPAPAGSRVLVEDDARQCRVQIQVVRASQGRRSGPQGPSVLH
jgi:mono/diheme cytochrome c family protein